MLRKTLRSILPPIVVQSVRQVLSWKDNLNGRLFDGDDLEFKAILRNCQTYMEYGCGASTLWVNQNSDCRIYSTDTSKEWIERVKGLCKYVARGRGPARLQCAAILLCWGAGFGRALTYGLMGSH
ncbi:MAG: hypothetical protein IPL38_19795 [Rhodobacter sp.]|nr:hypothetical protein [Rhodobacter sp.]